MRLRLDIKRVFDFILLLFIIIVPLYPRKEIVMGIPLSADFVFGSMLIGVGMLCVFIMLIKKEKITDIFRKNSMLLLSVLILFFMIISFSSIIYADVKGAALSECIRFLEYVLIFYLIITISDSKTIGIGFKIFYIIMLLASLIGIFQYLFNDLRWPVGGLLGRGRIYGTFDNPNYWGAAVNLVIFYPVINLFERKSKNYIFDIIAFSVFFFNLFFSSTRGSWLGFVVGIFFMGLIKYRRQAAYFLVFVFGFILIPATRNRFLQMINVNERLNLWKTGLYMFKENFWFGVGNGNYITEYRGIVTRHKELYLGRKEFSVHNSYIKMLAELGIIGGILFTLIYLSIFYVAYGVYKQSVKYQKYALAFLGFGVSYLFQNFFNNLIFIPQLNVFVWILCAMLYKGMYLEKTK